MTIEYADEYKPDYKHKCCNCGQTPVVTAVKAGKVVYQGEMCGPCTWGEARTADPETWNEALQHAVMAVGGGRWRDWM